jgi:hypothetical protein
MDGEDQKDIIKKVKTSGKDDEESSDDADDTSDETQDTDTEDTDSNNTEDDSENMFEMGMLDEVSLNDWKSKALINIYDEGDDEIKHILTRLISFNDNINRESFIKDLQEDHDNDDIHDVFKKLKEMGIVIPEPEPESEFSFMEEANLFLKNPKKNNMFQEGSNDILDEKDDRCTRIAKRKYDVWPSAYASGAVVKCRQGKIWKNVNENYLQELDNLEEKLKSLLANKQTK